MHKEQTRCKCNTGKPPKGRSQSGGFTTLAFVAMIPLLMALAAFGIDMKHYQTAQQQLQKATDAAALAGAEMLWSDGTYSLQTNTYTPDPSHAVVTAKTLAIAQLNIADGQSVSPNTPGMNINVQVTDPVLPTLPAPLLTFPPSLQGLGVTTLPSATVPQIQAIFAPTQGGSTGKVCVKATMTVHNMFGGIFGHPTDTVTAISTAGSAGPAYSINAGQLFPVAISWLSVPSVVIGGSKVLIDVPLVLKRVGDPIIINISPTLDQNGSFTTFATGSSGPQYVPQAIDQYVGAAPLELANQSNVLPPVTIGNSINLTYDAPSSTELVNQAANLSGKVIYVPVVVTNLPPGVVTGILGGNVGSLLNNVNSLASSLLGLNQVIGFAAVKVDRLSVSPAGVVTIQGMLVNGQRFGSNKYSSPSLLPATLDTLLSTVGISGGGLLPVVGPGQTYPLTATQAVKLLAN